MYPYGITKDEVKAYLKKQSLDRLEEFAFFLDTLCWERHNKPTKKATKKGKKASLKGKLV